jgi:hypothetical protein
MARRQRSNNSTFSQGAGKQIVRSLSTLGSARSTSRNWRNSVTGWPPNIGITSHSLSVKCGVTKAPLPKPITT